MRGHLYILCSGSAKPIQHVISFLKMIESFSKFESCGIPFFRFRTLNFLSNFLERRSFNFDDFASMVEQA